MLVAAAAIAGACASAAQLPVSAGFGSQPTLPEPETSPIPLVKVATARGWPAGQKPVATEGMTVAAFASLLSKADNPTVPILVKPRPRNARRLSRSNRLACDEFMRVIPS